MARGVRWSLAVVSLYIVVISGCLHPQKKIDLHQELVNDRYTSAVSEHPAPESPIIPSAASELLTVSQEHDLVQTLPEFEEHSRLFAQMDIRADGSQQADFSMSEEDISVVPHQEEVCVPVSETVWTFDQLLNTAVAQHPILRARRYEVEMAQARLISAGSFANPRLVFDTHAPVNNADATRLSGRLTFDVATAGKRGIRKQVAGAEIWSAQANLRCETDVVLLEVADAALETLYRQEMRQLKAELAQVALERSRLLVPNPGQNESPIRLADNVKAECSLVEAEAALSDAESLLIAARMRLSQAVGMPTPTLMEVAEPPEMNTGQLMSFDQFLLMARDHQPRISEVSKASALLRRSRYEHDLECANRFPDITIGPRYDDKIGKEEDEIGSRLSVDLPILYQNQGAICETAAQVKARQAEFEATEITILTELAKNFAEVTALHGQQSQQRAEVEAKLAEYERLLQSPSIQQVISKSEALDLRSTIAETRIRQAEQSYRYLRLRMKLELLLGTALTAP